MPSSAHTARLRRWKIFGYCGGRVVALLVCAGVDLVAACASSRPDITTSSGVAKLWRRRYDEIPYIDRDPWRLQDGTELCADAPVFETHLSTWALMRALARNGFDKKIVDNEETLMLAPILAQQFEVALVGRSISRARLAKMGWSARETPPSLHRTFDTFLRRLYLMAAGGAHLAANDEGPVAEVAISVADFIKRSERMKAAAK